MRRIIYLFVLIFLVSCHPNAEKPLATEKVSGDLIVFHAGSLSVPLKQVFADFKKIYPDVNILNEAAGSRECARKISELSRPCDVFLSADYQTIDQMLIPDHASWAIHFANNEMVIAYTNKSKFASKMDSLNWYKILSEPQVHFGRSNPDSDPCGYRSVISIKLAQIYYKLGENFTEDMLKKDIEFIRPKETDLLALLETNTIDYIFIYKSVALQHKLEYISLPNELNLSKIEFKNFYQQADIKLSGKKPGEFVTQIGEPIIYGITIPKSVKNEAAAKAFVEFFLEKEKGQKILEMNGQHSIVPAITNTYDSIPSSFQKFALKPSIK